MSNIQYPIDDQQEGETILSKIAGASLLKKMLFGGIFFVLLFLLAIPIFLSQQKKSPPPQKTTASSSESRIWQIVVSYNTRSQDLTLKKVTIIKGTAYASPFTFPPYKLLVLDKNKRVLFKTSIHITEGIIYNIDSTATGAARIEPLPETIETDVAIPYFADAESIEISKENVLKLRFVPPKRLSFGIAQASAQTPNCSSAINAVFISDGYTNLNKFHADVETARQTLLTTQPYASYPQILDLSRIIDNSAPLGCIASGIFNQNCVVNPETRQTVKDIVFSRYPDLPRDTDHIKFIVLVDAPPQLILGAADGLGGAYTAFQMHKFPAMAHEVEGHAIGYLYDRYIAELIGVNTNTSLRTDASGNPLKSNCTNLSTGEAFWRNAGVNTGYPGCFGLSLYAPGPQACSVRGAGTPDSIMSAGGCAGSKFDPVEEYWIKTQIISKYTSCQGTGSTPIPTTVSPPSISGKVVTPAGSGISGVKVFLSGTQPVFTDSGGNFRFSDLAASSYTLDKMEYNGQTISISLSQTLNVPPSISGIIITIPFSALTPNPTPVPTITSMPTAIPTNPPGGSGGTGGNGGSVGSQSGRVAPTPEEPEVLYECHERTATRIVEGKQIQISYLDCTPAQ